MKKLLLLLILSVGCTTIGPPESSSTWVTPAKIILNNVNAGSYVGQTVKIHNGKKTASQYKICYKLPDDDSGTVVLKEASQWVVISDHNPTINPGETRKVYVSLMIPVDAKPPKQWEFWISIQDLSDPPHPNLYQRWEIK